MAWGELMGIKGDKALWSCPLLCLCPFAPKQLPFNVTKSHAARRSRNALGPGFVVPHSVVRLYVISSPNRWGAFRSDRTRCRNASAQKLALEEGQLSFQRHDATPRNRFCFLQLWAPGEDMGKLGIYPIPHLFCRMLLIPLWGILTPLSLFINFRYVDLSKWCCIWSLHQ